MIPTRSVLPWVGRQNTRAGYDRWAASYDDDDPSTLLDEPWLSALFLPAAGSKILDLACGTGRYLRKLLPPHSPAIGLDLSRSMLLRARSLPNHSTVSWIQASADRLPFRTALFDWVLCGLVIDHLDNLAGFFRGVMDVLTPNGQAIVTAVHPDMQRLTGASIRFDDRGQECEITGMIHDVDEIIQAARSVGLTVTARHEPSVNEAVIARRPEWRYRLGRPALLLLALEKKSA